MLNKVGEANAKFEQEDEKNPAVVYFSAKFFITFSSELFLHSEAQKVSVLKNTFDMCKIEHTIMPNVMRIQWLKHHVPLFCTDCICVAIQHSSHAFECEPVCRTSRREEGSNT